MRLIWLAASILLSTTKCAPSVVVYVESGGGAVNGGQAGAGGGNAGGGNAGVPPTQSGNAGEPSAGGAEAAGVGGEGGEPSGSAGEGGVPEPLGPPARLLIHYRFDQFETSRAEDSSGNDLHGTFGGTTLPVETAGHLGSALALDSAQQQFVAMPPYVLRNRGSVSVACWLKLARAVAWDRLFDFNHGTDTWWFFSPTGWNSNTGNFGTRMALRTSSVQPVELQLTSTLPIQSWHHVAIVLSRPHLQYYQDGELAGALNDLPIGSDALGETSENWIGRSVFAADPYLSAAIDDFRVYTGALTASEVADLAAQ